jgi:hypothetical protein
MLEDFHAERSEQEETEATEEGQFSAPPSFCLLRFAHGVVEDDPQIEHVLFGEGDVDLFSFPHLNR